MELKPLKKLTGLDQDLSRTVQYTEEFISQITPNKFILGNMLEIQVSTNATSFNHKLGVVPQGWIIVDKEIAVDVWRVDWDDTTISFDASATANIKVWVF